MLDTSSDLRKKIKEKLRLMSLINLSKAPEMNKSSFNVVSPMISLP